MARVVVAGYYGFANTGDEALLSAIISGLRAERANLEIIVLSANPTATEAYHRVKAINRWNLFHVLAALHSADLFLSGGGTLLQDSTSLRSLTYYASLMLAARRLGTPVMVYANGIGPLRTRTGRALARRALLTASTITLRDARAAADLEEAIGPLPIPVRVTADPALTLAPPPPGQGRKLLQATGVPLQQPIVGLSLRAWQGSTDADWRLLAAAADHLAQSGVTVLFLPLQYGPDLVVARHVMSHMQQKAYVIPAGFSPQDFLAVLGEMEFVVGMRLHALILAVSRGVPVAGLVYDPKVEGFLTEVGQPVLGCTEALPADLPTRMTQAVAERAQARLALLPLLEQLRRKAQENARLAVGLLPAPTGARGV